jgi:hypothetical protein
MPNSLFESNSYFGWSRTRISFILMFFPAPELPAENVRQQPAESAFLPNPRKKGAGYLRASLIGAIPIPSSLSHTVSRPHMQATNVKTNRRRQDRIQAVLPVRVRGTDASGQSFEVLAHTLDLTATGARLGSIRRPLKALDTLTIFYRQRRMEFTVVWTKLLDGRSEYQIGLQAFPQEKEGWGMNLFISSTQPLSSASATSGAV